MLLVIYDIKTEDVIVRLRTKAQKYGEINQIFPNAFLLDHTVDKKVIWKEFMDIIANNGRIMIAQIWREDINGWLGNDSVVWVNSKSFYHDKKA